MFVAQQDSGSQAGTAYLLAGIVLFHVLFQVQITATTGVMEETWTRNLLNVLTTPVTELEYVVAIGVFGLLKCLLAMGALTVTTIVLFGFDLSQVGWAVVPVAGILILEWVGAGPHRHRADPALRPERRDPDLGAQLRRHGPLRRVLHRGRPASRA